MTALSNDYELNLESINPDPWGCYKGRVDLGFDDIDGFRAQNPHLLVHVDEDGRAWMDGEAALEDRKRQIRKIAEEAIADRNVMSFLCCGGNEFALDLVVDNHVLLGELGLYEEALLFAFTASRVNNCHFSTGLLKALFDKANRAKLLAAGDPLPDGDEFTIYRGVAGKRQYRRVRGYSWTLDLDRAKWFANRFVHLGNPAVYTATVKRANVLAYSNAREEQEIICCPRPVREMLGILETAAA